MLTHFTAGKVVDWGIKDANNMGAAMAPAAADTVARHLSDLNTTADSYDYIVTENDTKTASYKESLRFGKALNQLLNEMRSLAK